MNQKHLLRFIKKRMKTCADDVVCTDDNGREMTLKQVRASCSQLSCGQKGGGGAKKVPILNYERRVPELIPVFGSQPAE